MIGKMPMQVKFLLGAMVSAAVLIMAGFLINVRDITGLGANILNTLNSEGINRGSQTSENADDFSNKNDIDKDGLPDAEEILYRTDPLNPDTDGDGFLDGEEIISGHDPLIPGPNDLLSALNPNITQKLATLTISGLHEGSLKPKNPEFEKSMDNLVLAVLDDALNDLKTEIDYQKLTLSDPSKKNQEKYIKEISPLYTQFLNAFIAEAIDLEKNLNNVGKSGFTDQLIINYYENKALEFNEILNKLYLISIPENWKDTHLELMRTIGQIAQVNAYIAGGETDPIKALIGLNRFIQFLEIVPELTNLYINGIKDNRLNAELIVL